MAAGQPLKLGPKVRDAENYIVPGALTPEQLDAYALDRAIKECTRRLKSGDYVPRYGNRSPSPPPQYDSRGQRTNTREQRYRLKLEVEQTKYVDIALRSIKGYLPPKGFVRRETTERLYYLPVQEFPQINFMGLLLGPRGNTLSRIRSESGSTIGLRGRGSIKEGQNGSSEEPLHCVIHAPNELGLQKAVELIEEVVHKAIKSPEHQNDLKRAQLRELAQLNGTLRDLEGLPCVICGEVGHRKYDCPHREDLEQAVVCRKCGTVGHFARDCKTRLSSIKNADIEEVSVSNYDRRSSAADSTVSPAAPLEIAANSQFPTTKSIISDREINEDDLGSSNIVVDETQHSIRSPGIISLAGTQPLPPPPGIGEQNMPQQSNTMLAEVNPLPPGVTSASASHAKPPAPPGLDDLRPPPPPGMNLATSALPPPPPPGMDLANTSIPPPPPPPLGMHAADTAPPPPGIHPNNTAVPPPPDMDLTDAVPPPPPPVADLSDTVPPPPPPPDMDLSNKVPPPPDMNLTNPVPRSENVNEHAGT